MQIAQIIFLPPTSVWGREEEENWCQFDAGGPRKEKRLTTLSFPLFSPEKKYKKIR